MSHSIPLQPLTHYSSNYERTMQEMEEAKLILEGLDDVEAGRTVDGPTAMAELREKYGL